METSNARSAGASLFDEYQSKENAKHTLRAMKEKGRDSRELPRKLRPDLLATAPTGNRRHNGLRLRPMRKRQVV